MSWKVYYNDVSYVSSIDYTIKYGNPRYGNDLYLLDNKDFVLPSYLWKKNYVSQPQSQINQTSYMRDFGPYISSSRLAQRSDCGVSLARSIDGGKTWEKDSINEGYYRKYWNSSGSTNEAYYNRLSAKTDDGILHFGSISFEGDVSYGPIPIEGNWKFNYWRYNPTTKQWITNSCNLKENSVWPDADRMVVKPDSGWIVDLLYLEGTWKLNNNPLNKRYMIYGTGTASARVYTDYWNITCEKNIQWGTATYKLDGSIVAVVNQYSPTSYTEFPAYRNFEIPWGWHNLEISGTNININGCWIDGPSTYFDGGLATAYDIDKINNGHMNAYRKSDGSYKILLVVFWDDEKNAWFDPTPPGSFRSMKTYYSQRIMLYEFTVSSSGSISLDSSEEIFENPWEDEKYFYAAPMVFFEDNGNGITPISDNPNTYVLYSLNCVDNITYDYTGATSYLYKNGINTEIFSDEEFTSGVVEQNSTAVKKGRWICLAVDLRGIDVNITKAAVIVYDTLTNTAYRLEDPWNEEASWNIVGRPALKISNNNLHIFAEDYRDEYIPPEHYNAILHKSISLSSLETSLAWGPYENILLNTTDIYGEPYTNGEIAVLSDPSDDKLRGIFLDYPLVFFIEKNIGAASIGPHTTNLLKTNNKYGTR